MEFGKVAPEELKDINFVLPEDGLHTSKILTKATGEKAVVLLGCARWGSKEWVDYLYPAKTKEVNFLDEYAKHFNCIELNAAYHRSPGIETVRKWKNKVKSNSKGEFFFCPKFPKSITHDQKLVGAEKLTDDFITAVTEFEETLGACFLQLSESFGPENMLVLRSYLESLPRHLELFVELRQQHWFANQTVRQQILELLTKLQNGLVITDVSGRRDILHMELTIPSVFIRFIGNGAAHTAIDFARIDDWGKRLKRWQDNGLEKIQFFVHQQNERDTLQLANYAIQVFNKELGANLCEIKLQPSLF